MFIIRSGDGHHDKNDDDDIDDRVRDCDGNLHDDDDDDDDDDAQEHEGV